MIIDIGLIAGFCVGFNHYTFDEFEYLENHLQIFLGVVCIEIMWFGNS